MVAGGELGVQPVYSPTNKNVVVSGLCKFCNTFGREETTKEVVHDDFLSRFLQNPKKKRKTTTNIRVDNIKKHMKQCHSTRFEAFCNLHQRANFFEQKLLDAFVTLILLSCQI
jgi:hypothetical protein